MLGEHCLYPGPLKARCAHCERGGLEKGMNLLDMLEDVGVGLFFAVGALAAAHGPRPRDLIPSTDTTVGKRDGHDLLGKRDGHECQAFRSRVWAQIRPSRPAVRQH